MLKTKDLLALFRNFYFLPRLALLDCGPQPLPLSIIVCRRPVQVILPHIPKEPASRFQIIQEFQ